MLKQNHVMQWLPDMHSLASPLLPLPTLTNVLATPTLTPHLLATPLLFNNTTPTPTILTPKVAHRHLDTRLLLPHQPHLCLPPLLLHQLLSTATWQPHQQDITIEPHLCRRTGSRLVINLSMYRKRMGIPIIGRLTIVLRQPCIPDMPRVDSILPVLNKDNMLVGIRLIKDNNIIMHNSKRRFKVRFRVGA